MLLFRGPGDRTEFLSDPNIPPAVAGRQCPDCKHDETLHDEQGCTLSSCRCQVPFRPSGKGQTIRDDNA